MTGAQRRALVVTISWRALVTVLVAIAAWDSAGMLLGGSTGYGSESYDVARALPGGIRAWGVLLAACTVAVVIGVRRFIGADRTALVKWALAGLTAWWASWTVAIVASWLYHRTDPVRPAGVLGGLLLLAAAAAWRYRTDGLFWILAAAAGAWWLGWGVGLHIPAWGGPSKTAGAAALAWIASRQLRTAQAAEAMTPGGR